MKIRLTKELDSLMANFGEDDDEETVPVRLVYARPISARDQQIAIMDIKGKKELAWLDSIDDLEGESQTLAEAELWKVYRIAKVTQIKESYVNHGHRYLKVDTDRGERYFNLGEPGKNLTRLSPDHLVIRDSMGNRYEIESISALDETSQANLERVL
ncbi:MAG: hypothetical protein ACI8T1_001037 [Verrucomicrobiales bacterium]|jgi:hypothetical protein